MKKMLLLVVVLILLVFSFAGLSGYGSPFRTVTYTSPERSISGKEFFLTNCRTVRELNVCDFAKSYRDVLIFTQGTQGGTQHMIRGTDRAPLTLFAKYRRKLVSDPDYLLEAVKSCSNSHIHAADGYHSRSIIIPRTKDDFQTVQCVKGNIHQWFSAGIGNPQSFDVDHTLFKSLED